MDIIKNLIKRARKNPKRIVMPEGEDERIIRAAKVVYDEGIAIPILLGDERKIYNCASVLNIKLDGISIINPSESSELSNYCKKYSKKRGLPELAVKRILVKPCYFGAMMVSNGDADGMVAGVKTATEDVVMAANMLIGNSKGIKTPSSFFLMETPHFSGGERGFLIFADAAGNPNPTSEELADIAITTARSAKTLFEWKPRIAMLSFSTKGSANHPLIDKVLTALDIVKKREPSIDIDGELQADSALIPEVAVKKISEPSPVAGKANILIFPDLNAGNISYKLVQRIGEAKAYGPILQGYAKPISDLSRGATLDDIIGAIVMVSIQAQEV